MADEISSEIIALVPKDAVGDQSEHNFKIVSSDPDLETLPKYPLPSVVAHSRLFPRTPIAMTKIEWNSSESSASSQAAEVLTQETAIDTTSAEPIPIPALPPRHTKLQDTIECLQTQIKETETRLSQTIDNLRGTPAMRQDIGCEPQSDEVVLEQAQIIVTEHIRLLHQYNEIKDVGLGLMGLIAEKEGKRLGEVMEARGVNEKD